MPLVLSLSAILLVAPITAELIAGPNITTAITAIPNAAMLLLIVWSWKPLVTFSAMTNQAVKEGEAAVRLFLRATELRHRMLTERAAIALCAPSERPSAEAALDRTCSDLENVLSVLEPLIGESARSIDNARLLGENLPHRRAVAWVRRGLVQGLTGLAVAVAGERGARLRDTWQADLVGAPEEGLEMGRWQQICHAMGFVTAAARMRSRALAEPMWKPIDWLLATEPRTRTTTALAVGAQIIVIDVKSGLYVLITEGWGWCAGCAVAVHLLFRWLRGVRGVELATVEHSERD
jgi:hypothetical protein